MARLPYEQIAEQADKLFTRMTQATDLDAMKQYWEDYVSFLASVGWSPTEFDQEELKRVNEGWDDPKGDKITWN